MKKTVELIVSFKDDFIPFLENNQVYNAYIGSVLERHRRSGNKGEIIDLIYKKLQVISPSIWINGMFTWDETSKGQEFWSSINNLWLGFLQNEAGIEKFETVGEVSKSDVEKAFSVLRGQYYKVTDLSYNRPVTDEWDCEKWKPYKSSIELHEPGGIYLILSDYPEDKVMLWQDGLSSRPRPMIKVWVPELNKAFWVFYRPMGVYSKP